MRIDARRGTCRLRIVSTEGEEYTIYYLIRSGWMCSQAKVMDCCGVGMGRDRVNDVRWGIQKAGKRGGHGVSDWAGYGA
jgi:hypothetical protein